MPKSHIPGDIIHVSLADHINYMYRTA